jgi:hypothetical protein
VPYNYNLNFEGGKQVAMKTANYEELCVAVMLCVIANVNKLPPYVY